MQLGIITYYDEALMRGTITSAAGDEHSFRYADGQSFIGSPTRACPELSGHHAQAAGFKLKTPCVGDPVVFVDTRPRSRISWGYLSHFTYLVERRHGQSFATTDTRAA